MKIRIFRILLALLVALLTQAVVLSHHAAAQPYGESVYGGGVYEDSRTALEADQSPTSSGESVPLPGSDTTDPSEEPDSAEGQELSEHDQGPGDVDEAQDSTDENFGPVGEESNKSESNSRPYFVWLSLGALVTALLLFLFAVIHRRRKQD